MFGNFAPASEQTVLDIELVKHFADALVDDVLNGVYRIRQIPDLLDSQPWFNP
jgi:hypothetical protein